MNDDKAGKAISKASVTSGVERSLWLAAAVSAAIEDDAVLVGGAAVDLHTGVYRPTDVDMCAYLSAEDRQALTAVGFEQTQDDHFRISLDGQDWYLEFPDSVCDGDTMTIDLGDGHLLTTITPESLMVDRLRQATDRSDVTFQEATRLAVAVWDRLDWDVVTRDVDLIDAAEPGLRMRDVFDSVLQESQRHLPLDQ